MDVFPNCYVSDFLNFEEKKNGITSYQYNSLFSPKKSLQI